jgi:hypothetical protein
VQLKYIPVIKLAKMMLARMMFRCCNHIFSLVILISGMRVLLFVCVCVRGVAFREILLQVQGDISPLNICWMNLAYCRLIVWAKNWVTTYKYGAHHRWFAEWWFRLNYSKDMLPTRFVLVYCYRSCLHIKLRIEKVHCGGGFASRMFGHLLVVECRGRKWKTCPSLWKS